MTTETLIQKLSDPLATALESLGLHYAFVSESTDDKFTYLEYSGDGPTITLQIENVWEWHCRDCDSGFNSAGWDCDGDYCPMCNSRKIFKPEEEEG